MVNINSSFFKFQKDNLVEDGNGYSPNIDGPVVSACTPHTTVADKKNVAFSHQNNHFGLNKSIERMSRIYNRIFNG